MLPSKLLFFCFFNDKDKALELIVLQRSEYKFL